MLTVSKNASRAVQQGSKQVAMSCSFAASCTDNVFLSEQLIFFANSCAGI